jgi:hypothetical protein
MMWGGVHQTLLRGSSIDDGDGHTWTCGIEDVGDRACEICAKTRTEWRWPYVIGSERASGHGGTCGIEGHVRLPQATVPLLLSWRPGSARPAGHGSAPVVLAAWICEADPLSRRVGLLPLAGGAEVALTAHRRRCAIPLARWRGARGSSGTERSSGSDCGAPCWK